MKIIWFVHAIASCWNNGNAHFLRGLGLALQKLGHEVRFFEPHDSWSESNLVQDHGDGALKKFCDAFPSLDVAKYDSVRPDLDALTEGADLVIVHEWNDPALMASLGAMRKRSSRFALLFHDTHHRAATAPEQMRTLDLSGYDGVLAFGETIADIYRRNGWTKRVWSLHEAADTATFYPREPEQRNDLVWIGNWGDEERSAELREFLIEPIQALNLRAELFGVRYPAEVVSELAERGIAHRGWLPNHEAPEVFAKSSFTVHVPRRPYAEALPGIPTIRVFEALACGIPLISTPWVDSEHLFPSDCYLTARNGAEMQKRMREVTLDTDLRTALIDNGLEVIAARHTCDHRAEQLLAIYASLACVPTREAA